MRFRHLVLAAGVAAVLGTSGAAAADIVIGILTGGSSSIYYALGVPLAAAIAKAVPNAKTSVQGSRGSVENLNLLQAGRGDFGFALGDSLADAWQGREEAGFKAPLGKLRGVAALYPNYIQVVARADAHIASLADLKGKRISVGAPRSSTELNVRALLRAAGMTYRDFAKVEYLPFGESVELMKDRQIDIIVQSASFGASALKDLARAVDVVVVPIPKDVIEALDDRTYQPATIPAHSYRGQDTDVPTAAVENYLVTHDGVPADTVYSVTKALWTSLDQLVAANPAAKSIDLRTAVEGMPVPLHPGAERYYREVGVIR